MPVNDPEELHDVSTNVLAAHLGVTRQTIHALKNKKVIKQLEGRRGRYDLTKATRAYYNQGRDTAGGSESSAKTRLYIQQERKLQLENDAKEKTLIPIEEAREVVTDFSARLLSGVTALPGRLARELAQLDKPGEVRKFLNDEINKLRRFWVEPVAQLQEMESPSAVNADDGPATASPPAAKRAKRVGGSKPSAAKGKRGAGPVEK